MIVVPPGEEKIVFEDDEIIALCTAACARHISHTQPGAHSGYVVAAYPIGCHANIPLVSHHRCASRCAVAHPQISGLP